MPLRGSIPALGLRNSSILLAERKDDVESAMRETHWIR